MSEAHAREPATPSSRQFDAGLARDRTALAWTRTALTMAGNGILIARAAFLAHVVALGLATGVVMGVIAVITWRHGDLIYSERRLEAGGAQHQPEALRLLTAATLLTAAVAIVVTLAS
jgi:uncharacterized membrane protein YidH (DUF202 family)